MNQANKLSSQNSKSFKFRFLLYNKVQNVVNMLIKFEASSTSKTFLSRRLLYGKLRYFLKLRLKTFIKKKTKFYILFPTTR